MEALKVSIIAPIYNVSEYIEKFAVSLFEQTYKNIQYIFVDDCTPDNSIVLLKSVLEQYPHRAEQVQILRHEKNKGLPAARNTGLKKATGEYVYHCDSDDWLAPQLISSMVGKLVKDNADLVFSDFSILYPEGTIKTNLFTRSSFKGYLDAFCQGDFPGNVFNKMVKKSLYTDNNVFFPEGYSMLEDLRTMIPLFYYADKVVYCEEPLYFYRRDIPNSISGSNYTKSPTLSLARIENVKGIERFLKSKNVQDIDFNILKLKLAAKQNLLVHGTRIGDFKKWRETLPDTNRHIWKTNLPFYYKVLAWCADKEIWPVIRIWILVKYRLAKR